MTGEILTLTKRLIWSTVLISIAAYALFGAPTWLFLIVLDVIILLGLSEYFRMAETKGYFINRNLGFVFGGLLPLPIYVQGDVIILTVAVLCLFVFNFHKRYKEQAMASTSLTLFGLVYIAWFMSFMAKIRIFPDGKWWLFYVIFILKIGDAAAYFFGKRFGAHKLIPHVSPNKSVEGAVAGLVMTVAMSLASSCYLKHVPLLHLAGLGILLGVLGQLSDLSESLLKREAQLKDSGRIPGLGGILDVIDSLLLTVPVLYYYLATIGYPNLF